MDLKSFSEKERSYRNLRELNLRLWDRVHNLELAIEQEVSQKRWKRKQARKQLTRLAKYLDLTKKHTPETLK